MVHIVKTRLHRAHAVGDNAETKRGGKVNKFIKVTQENGTVAYVSVNAIAAFNEDNKGGCEIHGITGGKFSCKNSLENIISQLNEVSK